MNFDIDNFANLLPKNYKMKKLGDVLVFSPKVMSRKNLLVVGGIHGDEPGGPLGIVEFLKQSNSKELLDRLSVSFIPVMNIFGFEHNKRKNEENKDINRNFNINKDDSSKETQIILDNKSFIIRLARDGFLTLHEDDTKEKFYIYTYGEETNPKQKKLFDALLMPGKKAFGIASGKANDKYEIRNGFVRNVADGSFENYLADNGISGATTETPTKSDLKIRIEINRQIINSFLRSFLL
jgi:predicted deacylase